MKKVAAIILALTSSIIFSHQVLGLDLAGKIKDEANKSAQALMSNDLETVIRYTYPLIIEKMGGKERAISTLQQSYAQMQTSGVKFESVTIGNPAQIEEDGSLMHALVPQTIQMKVPDGRLIQDGYLLAISENGGEQWYFLDATNLTDAILSQVFPTLAGKITIPTKKEPVFIQN